MSATILLHGRAVCPVCGAARELGSALEVPLCVFCGTRTHVVRRLRSIEPLRVGGFEPAAVMGQPDGAGPPGREHGSVPCPGCAAPLATERRQEIVRCDHCHAYAKVGRTLEADRLGPAAEYPEPPHRFGLSRRRRAIRDRERDNRLAAALDEPNVDGRVALLSELTPWEALNGEREAAFTRLLRTASSHPLLDRTACALVRRFLQVRPAGAEGFGDHPWRYFVLRCVTRVAFRPDASGRLVRELEHVNGRGAALKLLLDVADHALRTDQLHYARDALEALDRTVAESDWSSRHPRNELLAHRLPYADERLAAWLLTRVSWLWMLDPPTMARLVDDCAVERPDLAPVLANEATYRRCASLDEYRDYIDFVQTLFTDLGRAVAVESFVHVPGPAACHLDPETLRYFLAFFEALRTIPEAELAATRLMRWWIDDVADHAPGLLPDTIAQWRDRLPADPTWPPPPRPAPYAERLESIAHDLTESVIRPSS